MTQATLIDGKLCSATLASNIQKHVQQLKQQHQITPGLAVVLIGEDPASQVYVRNKIRMTEKVGMNSFETKLPVTASQQEVLAAVDKYNQDDSVNGILVQLPLPKHLDSEEIINRIEHTKDVDGFHIVNVGKLSKGNAPIIPCTPLGCLILLKQHLTDLTGKNAVIIGRSNIVGKPMYNLLLAENCTVTQVHSKTKNIEAICRQADIVIAAIGRAKFVGADWIKPGAIVIDVGINQLPDDSSRAPDGPRKICGDVDFQAVQQVAQAITPVPGGVGPMTIACLLLNTLYCTLQKNQLPNTLTIEKLLQPVG